VVLLPLLLVYSMPFLLAAVAFEVRGGVWLDRPARRLFGLRHLRIGDRTGVQRLPFPRPMYIQLLAGEPVQVGAELLSLVLTRGPVALVAGLLARRRAHRPA